MRALEAAGGLAYWLGDGPSSVAAYRERLARAEGYGTRADVADAQFDLSFGLSSAGQAEAARQAWAAARSGYSELGDALGVARCGWVESSFNLVAQQFSEARGGLTEIIPILREYRDYNY